MDAGSKQKSKHCFRHNFRHNFRHPSACMVTMTAYESSESFFAFGARQEHVMVWRAKSPRPRQFSRACSNAPQSEPHAHAPAPASCCRTHHFPHTKRKISTLVAGQFEQISSTISSEIFCLHHRVTARCFFSRSQILFLISSYVAKRTKYLINHRINHYVRRKDPSQDP